MIVKKEFQHLGQVTDKLPSNCIYDKGKVGCGGTSVALESNTPYVVAVPFQSLIENKVSQYLPHTKKPADELRYLGEVFGVMAGVLKRDVDAYIVRVKKSGFQPKFMVTFDSLGRLTNWINPKEYNILIDEMHILFTAYSYRHKAAQIVLEEYKRYNEFCFMTATVLEPEFILEELSHIPIKETVWEDVREVDIRSIQCKSNVSSIVVQIIREFLDNTRVGNAYFFVNSVEFIKEMVQYIGLNDDIARAIYSKGNKTETGLVRSNTYDEAKKINFITSTAFEGADIYDEDGVIFIVSDNRKPHTLTDISTSAQQIAGRVRNTKYWKEITHLFTNTRYNVDKSYEEFKEGTLQTIEDAKSIVKEYNGLSERAKANIKSVANESYVNIRDNNFIFDANLVKIDLYNYKVTKCLYRLRVNVQREYEKYGFNVINGTHSSTEVVRMDRVDDKNFEEIVQEIENERIENPFGSDYEELLEAATIKYPFIREAISKIGFDGLRELNYVVTNVKFRLGSIADTNTENRVFKMLKTKLTLSPGTVIPARKVKAVFGQVWSELGSNKKGVATDIETYYETIRGSKRIDGKVTDCYTIVRARIFINN